MTLTLALPEALAVLCSEGSEPHAWNPVYRFLSRDSAGHRESHAPGSSLTCDAEVSDLLRRHVEAPALIVLAVQEGATTHRLRVGLHADGATVETSHGESPPTWEELPAREAGRRLAAALPERLRSAAPELTQGSPALRRGPTPAQAARLAAAVRDGAPLAQAVDQLGEADGDLRDLMLADRDRVSLTLSLTPVPSTDEPVVLTRLWVRGDLGLYRIDRSPRLRPEALLVADGDVLRTLLALLQQGLSRVAVTEGAGR
ncbi:hypothetical protein JSY14_09855 [Brachybacterium sp. EF45031]|uniref:hypothetical protein n=1 Tax=Brachybacterium sillae TaxID=2810536 RepID=UPI00217EB7E5|nr:hypothetical protein [Brachybacterium sillae]MCS6712307.1 hypothetical protein [Brachybacterium sillae]